MKLLISTIAMYLAFFATSAIAQEQAPPKFIDADCAMIYKMKYVGHPGPKIFYSYYSRWATKIACNWWVRETAPDVAKFNSTEEAIAFTRKQVPQFHLIASDDGIAKSAQVHHSDRHTTSSPSWGQILSEGVTSIVSARANRGSASPSSAVGSVPEFETPARSVATNLGSSSNRAQLAPASCATYRADRYEPVMDSTYVEWRNACTFPIEVHWCWMGPGEARCKTDNAGNTLSPGETQTVVGPNGNVRPIATFYACNMSDPSKVCSGWD